MRKHRVLHPLHPNGQALQPKQEAKPAATEQQPPADSSTQLYTALYTKLAPGKVGRASWLASKQPAARQWCS